MKIWTESQYDQPVCDVAKKLIGCYFYYEGRMGIITETEAYSGDGDDPSSHSHGVYSHELSSPTTQSHTKSHTKPHTTSYATSLEAPLQKKVIPLKISKAKQHLFHSPGYMYVYLIYGMYHCLNFTAGSKGSAVLIRALLQPQQGLWINGPGKICHYLHITKQQDGTNLIGTPKIYVAEMTQETQLPYTCTQRIGINKATHLLWRYVVPKEILKKKYGKLTIYKTRSSL